MKTVKQFYESVDFDRMITETPRLMMECIERESEIVRAARGSFGDVLEVGYGYGRILEMLSGTGRIVGIDFCEAMVEQARTNCVGLGTEIYLMNADEIGFSNESFDTVLCLNHTMSNMPGIEGDVLYEMFRVCRWGGRVMVSVYSERARDVQMANYLRLGLRIERENGNSIYLKEGLYSRRFSRRDIRGLFKSAGFPCRITSLNSISYLVVASKE
jgi:ubiquinone/menaquinone biosynthesis C-methylase UbiE